MSYVGVVSIAARIDYETFPEPKRISSVLTVSVPAVANRSVDAYLWTIIVDTNDNSPVFSQDVRNPLLNLSFPYIPRQKI